MKTNLKRFFLPLLFVVITGTGILAGTNLPGIDFNQLTWQQVQAKAKAKNKLIFVDFYATWCGPCKYLEKEVFTQAEVGQYFNANFINLRIDAEKEEQILVNFVDIEAYPTLIVFDKNGNIIKKVVGALDASELIEFGKGAVNIPKVIASYEANPNDYLNTLNYLEVIAETDPDKANDIALKQLDILKEEYALKSAKAWKIMRFVNDYDSYIVDFVFNYKEFYSEFDNFEEFGIALLNSMLEDAVEQENLELLERAKKFEVLVRSASGTPDHSKEYYGYETDYLYYKFIDDFDGYITRYDTFLRKFVWDDAEFLSGVAISMIRENSDVETDINIRIIAMNWVKRGLDIDIEFWYPHYAAAYIEYYYDDYQSALKYANKALKLLDEEDQRDSLNEFILELENELN